MPKPLASIRHFREVDYTQSPTPSPADSHHRDKLRKLSHSSLLELPVAPTQSTAQNFSNNHSLIKPDEEEYGRLLLNAPPEIRLMIANFSEPESLRLLRHNVSSLYREFIDVNKHIIVEKVEALPEALKFFSANRKRTLTLKGNGFNADDLKDLPASLKDLRLVNWHDLTDLEFVNILTQAPELSALKLQGCKNLFKEEFLKIAGPDALQRLKSLQSLDLSNTNIDDKTLKAILAHTPNLTSLNLAGCKHISENAFVGLNKNTLEKLQFLDLSNTDINAESLKATLECAPNLTSLNLANCYNPDNLFGDALKNIEASGVLKNLAKLQFLDLSNTDIDDESLQIILKHTPNLTSLKLRGCYELSSDIFKNMAASDTLKNLAKLQSLDLSDTDIDDEGLALILAHTPNLTSLELNGCDQLSRNVFKNMAASGKLEKLAKLQLLNLSRTKINGKSLAAILAHTPNLTSLELNGCHKLSSDVFKNIMILGTLKNLQSLDLSDTNIDDESLAAILAHTPNLTSLKLKGCRNLSSNAFTKLDPLTLEKLKNLQSLDLSDTNINDESLAAILAHTPNLTSLELNGCDQLSSNVFKNMAASGTLKNLAKLQSLNLSNTDIDDESLEAILAHTPNLTSLELNGCDQLSRNVFKNMAASGKLKNLAKLQSLDLSNTNIDDENLEAILAHTPNLTFLNLDGSANLSEDAFKNMAHSGVLEKLKNLQILDLSYTNINDTSLIAILTHIKKLDSLALLWCHNFSTDVLANMDLNTLKKLKNIATLFDQNFTNINDDLLDAAIEARTLNQLNTAQHNAMVHG